MLIWFILSTLPSRRYAVATATGVFASEAEFSFCYALSHFTAKFVAHSVPSIRSLFESMMPTIAPENPSRSSIESRYEGLVCESIDISTVIFECKISVAVRRFPSIAMNISKMGQTQTVLASEA